MYIKHSVNNKRRYVKSFFSFCTVKFKNKIHLQTKLFSDTTDQPTPLMLETARDLVDYAVKRGYVVRKDVKKINYWEKKLKTVTNLQYDNIFI